MDENWPLEPPRPQFVWDFELLSSLSAFCGPSDDQLLYHLLLQVRHVHFWTKYKRSGNEIISRDAGVGLGWGQGSRWGGGGGGGGQGAAKVEGGVKEVEFYLEPRPQTGQQ